MTVGGISLGSTFDHVATLRQRPFFFRGRHPDPVTRRLAAESQAPTASLCTCAMDRRTSRIMHVRTLRGLLQQRMISSWRT